MVRTELWESHSSEATSEAEPIHDWQKEELPRRKANLLQSPQSGLSWEEVQRRVRGCYGR